MLGYMSIQLLKLSSGRNQKNDKHDKHVSKYVNIKASKYQSRYINIKAELFYLKVETYF
jgi:hypothetical protein